MKLISLNTWCGVVFEPLINFVSENKDADIFCFQEICRNDLGIEQLGNIRPNLLVDLQTVLSNHKSYFYPVIGGYNLDGEHATKVDFDLEFGLAIFVKNSIKVKSSGEKVICDDKTGILNADFSNLPVYLQFMDFENLGKDFTVCNFHGIPKPGNKLDTSERIDQSKKILDFLSTRPGSKILAGDFNLLPETKSIHLIEQQMVNLIAKYNIEKTRSRLSLYWGKADFQGFADYIFISNVVVEDFKVPDVEIADHLPMILQFS